MLITLHVIQGGSTHNSQRMRAVCHANHRNHHQPGLQLTILLVMLTATWSCVDGELSLGVTRLLVAPPAGAPLPGRLKHGEAMMKLERLNMVRLHDS